MISKEQIEEWIREVEQRPQSAALIIQYIAQRLSNLAEHNEALLAENVELRTGKKVEGYESRIANLEYQLEIIRRQVGGVSDKDVELAPAQTVSLLLYSVSGQVLRAELNPDSMTSGETLARIREPVREGEPPPRLLIVPSQQEMLFVFDSGRCETHAVTYFPPVRPMEMAWSQAALVEPRGGEELSAVLPIGTMSLFDFCVQASRRACVKLMMRTAFENHIARSFIGAGIKQKPDKPCSLALSNRGDRFMLASREGFLVTLDVERLPYTTEDVLRLSATDYIVQGINISRKNALLFITYNGKAIHREPGWLQPAETSKSRGQPLFSQARREAGVRLAGAVAVNENDWAVALLDNGEIIASRAEDLFNRGALGIPDTVSVLDVFALSLPGNSEG